MIEVLLIPNCFKNVNAFIFLVHGNGYLMFDPRILGDQSQIHNFIAHSQNRSDITHVIPPVALAV